DTMQRTRVLGADRVALFGYAHVPHVVPRQKAVDARDMPDQDSRFAMAAQGHAYFCTHGYVPVGFDHFARAGSDPLAHAAMAGTVHRNFQGFTDDDAPVLIGLGASAISSFPHLLVQNEKNSGRYRMLLSQGHLAQERGIARSSSDQERATVIEQVLCIGHAHVPPALLAQVTPRLAPFIERGLASLDQEWLTIEADGLPYARTIAALFDPWRTQSQARFSTAV
ncbi:MAG: coproporphyrinogen III oxidase, partial [Sphingomonadaceae bacterium]|nr:coproporphyrinogen III oxidase [Sphingomonadaceae bacterium]